MGALPPSGLSMRRIAAFSLLVVLAPRPVWAGGFEFPDNGVRALGRAGAFVARADDPTAIYHNPAGLTRMARPSLLMDINVSHVDYGFQRAATERTTRSGQRVRVPEEGGFEAVSNSAPPFPAPFLSYVHPMGDWAVGVGVYGPSAYGWREFPADGPQRYHLVKSELLLTYTTLSLGWKAWDGALRLGISAQAASIPKMHIELKTDGDPGILTTGQARYVQREDDRWDNTSVLDLSRAFMPTGVVGVLATPAPWLELGLSYRPGFDLRADGTLEMRYSKFFTYDPDPADPTRHNAQREAECATNEPDRRYLCSRAPRLTDDRAMLRLTFPHIVKAGVRYVARTGAGPGAEERFDVELDVTWEGWSSVDDMRVDFAGELEFNPFFAAPITQSVPLKDRPIVLPHDWLDVFSVRLGGDWRVTDRLTLRGGATWESSTFASEAVDLLADGFSRVTAAVGMSYQPLEGLRLSVGGAMSFADDFASTGQSVRAQVPLSDCMPPHTDASACAYEGEATGNAVGEGVYSHRISLLGLGLTAAF